MIVYSHSLGPTELQFENTKGWAIIREYISYAFDLNILIIQNLISAALTII